MSEQKTDWRAHHHAPRIGNQEQRGCAKCGELFFHGKPCGLASPVLDSERSPERHGSQFPQDSEIHIVANCARHFIAEYEASSVTDGDLFDLFRALMNAGYATPSVKAALNRTMPQPPPEAALCGECGHDLNLRSVDDGSCTFVTGSNDFGFVLCGHKCSPAPEAAPRQEPCESLAFNKVLDPLGHHLSSITSDPALSVPAHLTEAVWGAFWSAETRLREFDPTWNWKTIGIIKVDPESETETFERISPPVEAPAVAETPLTDMDKALLNKVYRAVHDLVCPNCGDDMRFVDGHYYKCYQCNFRVSGAEMVRMQPIVQEWGRKAVAFFEVWRIKT